MLSLIHPASEIYFPKSPGDDLRLAKTTHLGIGAHQDDLEILAMHGILDAYDNSDRFFTGVTVTDGRGAPRPDAYKAFDDDVFCRIRCTEQKKAADIGHYNAQFLLNHPSHALKSGDHRDVIEDLKQILTATNPSTIYTHNLADKHDTHVAVALCVIQALRTLTPPLSNLKIFGCEIWRGLDWLMDDEKVIMDVSKYVDLQKNLLEVYESQVSGGKRYDLAAIGRQQANATFLESRQVDKADRVIYAMDLTPLVRHPDMDINQYLINTIQNFTSDVTERINHLRKGSG